MDVAVVLHGQHASTPALDLRPSDPSAFHDSVLDQFVVHGPCVGPLCAVTLLVHMQGCVRWRPMELLVTDDQGNTAHVPCGQWLDALHQHGQLSLVLPVGAPGVAYEVAVATGGKGGLPTGALVTVNLQGAGGESGALPLDAEPCAAFQPDQVQHETKCSECPFHKPLQVDVFTVDAAHDVGLLHGLVLTVQAPASAGMAMGPWDLQGVDVTTPSGRFECMVMMCTFVGARVVRAEHRQQY